MINFLYDDSMLGYLLIVVKVCKVFPSIMYIVDGMYGSEGTILTCFVCVERMF